MRARRDTPPNKPCTTPKGVVSIGKEDFMKKTITLLLAAAFTALPAAAKDINIASDNSGLPQKTVDNIAQVAVSAGVTEPLHIKKTPGGVSVTGASGSHCNIKVENGQIKNVSCGK